MDTFGDLLYRAATDLQFLRAFQREPAAVVAAFHLSEQQRDALLSRDNRSIRRLLGPKPEPDNPALVVAVVVGE